MSGGLGIRTAAPEDALEVARVHVRSWQVAYRGLIDEEFLARLRPEDRASGYRFGTGDTETILAVEGETIVGFAALGRSRDEDTAEAGEVFALYVDPPRWGSGAGRLLLQDSRERLRGQGFAKAILWVLIGNERAERFYRRDGWSPDGTTRVEHPYGVTSHVARFRRDL